MVRWHHRGMLLRRFALRTLSLALVSALLAGHAPLGAQSAAALPSLGDGADLSPASERRLGDSIARQLYRDPDYLQDLVLMDYVQTIWQPLLAAARQRGEVLPLEEDLNAWQILLGRDRSVNAFALPGGYMGLHLGLIGATQTRAELASVLAHELSHVTQRHIARNMARQSAMAPWVVGAMVLGVLAASKGADNAQGASAAVVGGQALAVQSQLNYSRDMEREADRIGYGVMTEAGYEPMGFVTMFEKLQQAARLNDNGSFPYLRSHPMTNERIADAQARQQLLPLRPALALRAVHAMMAARAQVLTGPGVDGLRAITAQATASNLGTAPVAKQAGVLYGATLAEMSLREWASAQQHLTRLQALPQLEASAVYAVRLLSAELALASGDASQALAVTEPKARVLAPDDRAGHMLLARSRLASKQAGQAKLASQDLMQWVNQHPRDAMGWQLLSSAYEMQGDNLRAIRAQAESRAVELDYPAAVDRLKAAQELGRMMSREGRLDRGGHIEASIIDARLRALESLRREQALQR